MLSIKKQSILQITDFLLLGAGVVFSAGVPSFPRIAGKTNLSGEIGG